ncbi:hypothetical protein ACFWHS_03230 [Glutamicibacter sp. NPDC058337]
MAVTESANDLQTKHGSIADAFEPETRRLVCEYPRMPATAIDERIE